MNANGVFLLLFNSFFVHWSKQGIIDIYIHTFCQVLRAVWIYFRQTHCLFSLEVTQVLQQLSNISVVSSATLCSGLWPAHLHHPDFIVILRCRLKSFPFLRFPSCSLSNVSTNRLAPRRFGASDRKQHWKRGTLLFGSAASYSGCSPLLHTIDGVAIFACAVLNGWLIGVGHYVNHLPTLTIGTYLPLFHFWTAAHRITTLLRAGSLSVYTLTSRSDTSVIISLGRLDRWLR